MNTGAIRLVRTMGAQDDPGAFHPGYGVSSVATSKDGRRVAYRIGEWSGPGRLHVIDVASGRILASSIDQSDDDQSDDRRARTQEPALSPDGTQILAVDEKHAWWIARIP